MANFKAALKALGTGKLKHESLSKQLDSVLNASPKFASKMLSDLDEAYNQKKLNDNQYSVLKDQIIKFKQAQTSAVKSSSPSRKQKKTSTESTISPETQKIDDNSLAATIIAGEEKTVIGGEEKATKTATQSNTTKTTATISPNTTTSSKEDEGNFGPGSIIKQRFKLEKVLGIG